MSYLFSVWCALAVGVLSMAVYRKMIARREDDLVHLSEGDASLVDNQTSVAAQLSLIDKWGQNLTIITVIFGLVIGSMFLYNAWLASAQLQR